LGIALFLCTLGNALQLKGTPFFPFGFTQHRLFPLQGGHLCPATGAHFLEAIIHGKAFCALRLLRVPNRRRAMALGLYALISRFAGGWRCIRLRLRPCGAG